MRGADERSGSARATHFFLLRGQPRIVLNPVGARGRDPCFGGGNTDRVGLSQTHERRHLVVVDVEAGQNLIPQKMRRIKSFTQSLTTARRLPKNRRRG